MKIYFKQRIFSWLDSYEIYDENNNIIYIVKGEIAFGHCLRIYNSDKKEVGCVKERILSILPRFDLYSANEYLGSVKKEFKLFSNDYIIDFCNWHVNGDYLGWDYEITDEYNNIIARISKELFHMSDQYVIDVKYPSDILNALMLVLAIDAEKCSRN